LTLKGEVLSDNDVLGQFIKPQVYMQRTYNGSLDYLHWKGGHYRDLIYDFSSVESIEILNEKYTLVNNGSYHLCVNALRIFGDVNNIDDWDSFTLQSN
jgi:hypothetical protein